MIQIHNLFKIENLPANLNNIIEYGPISSSLDSEYIPLFAGHVGKVFTVGNKKAIKYSFFTKQNPTFITPQNFEHSLNHYFSSVVQFKNGNIYYLNKHSVAIMSTDPDTKKESPKLMWVLTVKAEHFFNIDFDNPDTSKFMLIVSNDILLPEHKVIKLKFNKYIMDIHFLGIDVMYTNDVNRRCLVNGFNIPKFKNVKEMNEHIQQIKQQLKSIDL